MTDVAASPARLVTARGVEAVLMCDHAVSDALRDLENATGPARGPRLPSYHSRRAAGCNALRTFLFVAMAGALLVALGLPSSSTTLLFVCVLAGLSANTPDPARFATGALVAIPPAIVAAGVLQFVLLDGVDAFPLLAMALLPTTLVGCLMMAAGRPALAGAGFFLLVFTPVLMSLANPQKYNPEDYLSEGLFVMAATVLLFITTTTLLRVDDVRRKGWMLRSIRDDLRAATAGRHPGPDAIEAASFRAADRLAQLAVVTPGTDGERDATLSHALHLTEVTFSVIRLNETLGCLDPGAADEARAALRTLDTGRLWKVVETLRGDDRLRRVGAEAARTAALIDCYAPDLALARAGAAPFAGGAA